MGALADSCKDRGFYQQCLHGIEWPLQSRPHPVRPGHPLGRCRFGTLASYPSITYMIPSRAETDTEGPFTLSTSVLLTTTLRNEDILVDPSQCTGMQLLCMS